MAEFVLFKNMTLYSGLKAIALAATFTVLFIRIDNVYRCQTAIHRKLSKNVSIGVSVALPLHYTSVKNVKILYKARTTNVLRDNTVNISGFNVCRLMSTLNKCVGDAFCPFYTKSLSHADTVLLISFLRKTIIC